MKIALFILFTSCASASANDALLLRAIALKETGNNPRAISRTGDVGAHGMCPAAIHDNGTPQRHLAWLKHQNDRTGVSNDVFTLALEWRSGWTRATTGRSPDSHYQYALDVQNLYDSLSASVLSSTKDRNLAREPVWGSPSMTATNPVIFTLTQ